MVQTEINILNLEDRLLHDRRILNDLIYQYQNQGMENGLLNDKLNQMQQEIDYMNRQLETVKVAAMQSAVPQQGSPVHVQPQQSSPVYVQSQQGSPVHVQSQQTTMPYQNNKDMEKTFGKSWMGVIASGLIFISLIIFAILLVPNLTDGIKMTAMFLVSFAFTGVGLMKLKKERTNTFYLALSGCGIGAVYISLLVSNLYFKRISDIALYLFILVWAMGVCILGREGSLVFKLIGQFGILISVAFGSIVCMTNRDSVRLLILVVFFILTSAVFMMAHKQKPLMKNLINLAFNLVNTVILTITCVGVTDDVLLRIAAILLILYTMYQAVFCYLCEASDMGVELCVLNSIYVLLVIGILNIIVNHLNYAQTIGGICLLGLSVLSIWCGQRRIKGAARELMQAVMMLYMFLGVNAIDALNEHVYLALLMIPFLCLGIYKNHRVFRYGSLCFMFLLQFHSAMNNPEKMMWGVLYFGILSFGLIKYKQYNEGIFRFLAYVVFLIALSCDCSYIAEILDTRFRVGLTIWCVAVGGVNLVLSRVPKMTLDTESGKEMLFGRIIIWIVQGSAMLVSLFLIAFAPNETVHLLMVLWALVLFIANTKNLLERFKGMPVGIYVGIKLTLLLIVIIKSFNAANFCVSIGCFILAIISIVAGFQLHYKSLRIYGLVLSMLSVLKLIMIDMTYGNLLEMAAGFFISGILCFVISLIYTTIDKKYGYDGKAWTEREK